MIVWAAMIPPFILTTIRNIVPGIVPPPAGLTRWVASWISPIIATRS